MQRFPSKQSALRRPYWLALLAVLAACGTPSYPPGYTPTKWERFVSVPGQDYPVPEQWLATAEGRIAHHLLLPDSVPKPVPFDFAKAQKLAWGRDAPNVAWQYFDHLCKTEAGAWVFRTVDNVEGLYFARPEAEPSDDILRDSYGPEAPWIERQFQTVGQSLHWQGRMFVNPPYENFKFVEQPRRNGVDWQKAIAEPYIRLFGFTTAVFIKPGQVVAALNELTPMQVIGIARPTARYGYTWRGLRRPRDREFNVAGGEILVYDLGTHEVLGINRSFSITGRNARGPGCAVWLTSLTCEQTRLNNLKRIEAFAYKVLKTSEPSKI